MVGNWVIGMARNDCQPKSSNNPNSNRGAMGLRIDQAEKFIPTSP